MSRWEPDARGRLAQAALELYSERGYDQVTVAEIAQRAGLTERTFFRHYADKREVLSYGAALLQERLVRGVEEAPAGMAPVDVVGAALESAAEEVFGADGTFAARRQAVVAASPELLERELIKMAMFAVAVAAALRRRGVAEPAASLAAEAGIAVFKVAYQRWADEASQQPLRDVIRTCLAELKTVTAQDSG
jgi:AcrR family transcriptional regulator